MARHSAAWSGAYGSAAHGRLRSGEEAVLLEHADPARRVALNDELLVIDVRVGVRPVLAQYGVDYSQQLVGGGEDGSFVADATGEHPVIVVELRALGPRGAVGALGGRWPPSATAA